MRQLFSHFGVALILTAACGGGSAISPEPEIILAVETDKPGYSLGADRVARVTLINRSERPVYLPMGSYLECERLVEGEWRDAFQWFAVDGIGRSLPLVGGAARTDELDIRDYLDNRPGTYRFQYRLYADHNLRAPVPLEERVSQPFTISR
jgi:hypothetical protein